MNDNGLSLEPEGIDEPTSRNRTGGGQVVRILLILLASMCGMSVLCVGGFAYVIYRATQPVAEVGSTFLQSIADENYAATFGLLDSSLQSEYGSAEALGSALRERNIAPQRWSFNSRSVDNETAELGSTVVMRDGTERDVLIQLQWTGTVWLIDFFAFD